MSIREIEGARQITLWCFVIFLFFFVFLSFLLPLFANQNGSTRFLIYTIHRVRKKNGRREKNEVRDYWSSL